MLMLKKEATRKKLVIFFAWQTVYDLKSVRMTGIFEIYLGILFMLVVLALLAGRLHIPYPIFFVIGGTILGFNRPEGGCTFRLELPAVLAVFPQASALPIAPVNTR